jgi:hypothetical protein
VVINIQRQWNIDTCTRRDLREAFLPQVNPRIRYVKGLKPNALDIQRAIADRSRDLHH